MKKNKIHDFNFQFGSEIVSLPKNIICVGNSKGGIFEYSSADFPRCTNVLRIIRRIILDSGDGKYLLLCCYDGYRERIAFKKGILEEYLPHENEFDLKDEIDSNPGKAPILHKKKSVLCFNKHINDHTAICLPDPHIINTRESIYQTRFNLLDEKSVSWREKKDMFMYRGNLRPGGYKNFFNPNPNFCSPRKHFLMKAQESNFSELIDVGIDMVNLTSQIQYKYLFDIDGNTNTWDSLIWKMYSGSAVIKQSSIWKQWYYDLLVPWKHFIPVENDFSNLDAIIEWCLNNDDKCQEISENAKAFISSQFSLRKLESEIESICSRTA